MDNTLDVSKRLTQLRQANKKNIQLIRKACRNTNGGKGWCEKYLGDESICLNCIPREVVCRYTQYHPTLNQECLADGTGLSFNTIQNVEQNKGCSDDTLTAYKNFFGEDLLIEYGVTVNATSYVAGGGVFQVTKPSKPNWFFEREAEIEKLNEIFEKDFLTIVCADGGVGKTTLVREFLSKCLNGKYKFYQTILFSNENEFSEDKFIEKIVFSKDGENEFENYLEKNKNSNVIKSKKEFVIDKLASSSSIPVFLLDDFTCVDKKILTLQDNYPNCKFIVTTRNVKGIGNNYSDCILRLNYFTKEQALKVFNGYREDLQLGGLSIEEFEPIYSWCLGNAEVLYFISQMLDGKSLTRFNEHLINNEFSAENKKTGEDENSLMAKKLSVLFDFDGYLPSFKERVLQDNSKWPAVRALAVLSINGSRSTDRESLVKYLSSNGFSEDFAYETLNELLSRGYVKSNGDGGLYMHPLMGNALKLNDIEKQYLQDDLVFAHLTGWDYKAGLLFLSSIDNAVRLTLPNGLKKVPYMGELFGLKEVFIGRDINECSGSNFKDCLNLQSIEVSSENKYFKSVDGNLLSKDGKIFIRYASGKDEKSFILPSGVEIIGDGAFECALKVKSVTISEGVKVIKQSAFDTYYSYGLTVERNLLDELYLPSSLKVVEDWAFTSGARKVYYSGSKEEWDKIDFGQGNLKLLNEAELHFKENK